ncbi:MAG: GNAT family N-acetyltransferase [Acidimicrobiales bacterium]
MRCRVYQSGRQFLTAAEAFLRFDPFSANVIAVVATRVAESAEPGGDNLWATVEGSAGNVVGTAMHTPPHHLFVSRMPGEAATELAATLAGAGRELPGVNGAVASTTAFSEAWAERTGQASTVITAMRMYRLGRLARPAGVPGQAALATSPGDVELVAGWSAAFHAEAVPHTPVEDWRAFAERRIAAGQVHLWWDGGTRDGGTRDGGAPVALAAVSAPAASVARVGPVYTPPGSRRRGYGAAVTAEATAAALHAGAGHVILYTDLANPTSNSIYQAIGYRPDHDAEERVFNRPR